MTHTNPMAIALASKRGSSPSWPLTLFGLVSASTIVLLALGDLTGRLVWSGGFLVLTALALLVWARGGRLGGAAALLLGVVGLVNGIGIGLRWLEAGAVTWKTVVGMLALVTGTTLTVWGLIRLTKGMRSVPRVISGILAFAAVVILTWTLTPAIIASNVPPVDDRVPMTLDPDGTQVTYTSADGVRLWGWYVPPPEGKVAIVRHGSGSTASDVTRQAQVLVANGFGVLMTDARGHGRSEGAGSDFGWFGEEDIAAAVDFLAGRPEVDSSRIAILGISMGGEEAIGAAGSDDRVAAVVAEGATARTDADKIWLIDEYGWRGWIQVRLEWLQYSLADLLTDATKPRSLAIAAALADPTPILMITGGGVPDEAKAASHIQAASPGNVSVWSVPGAGHIQGLATTPIDWERVVVGFLDAAMRRH